jgi:type IV pilus assembly protein PilP
MTMPLKTALVKPLLLSCLALTLAACTKPMDELEGYVQTTLRKDPPPLDQIPPIKTFFIREYPAAGLRDPFASGEDALAEPGEEGLLAADDPDCPDTTRIPEELESFPLDVLDMVGTMGQGTNYYGLVKDPDGIVHRVQVNNYLGQNYGQILSIAEDKIELEERVKDGNGCERRTQAIALDDNN